MTIFKCKMCGGDLEITPGSTVCECEYCGTQQTLPKIDDDRRANMYDRANHFRRANEFDKAMSMYEKILEEDKTDSEAYWSIVLCRYGIEYVEDPATRKRIPTVNRAQFTSIFMDEDYKSAIEYADAYQRTVYEAEAAAIDEIQKGILAISQNEEPFDVFICYKETGADGRRTRDSVIATDLYHQLTQEGFKVFFARITLEDKLGQEYEPYIFAALNSAKVMVVLGTKPEHFNAVWVKNEWSRYLMLIRNGAKKTLIPAYRDMDPYDLPEEFSHLQAQDMNKLGFMQDLIRGIKKITDADKETPAVNQTTVINNNAVSGNIEPLLKRAFMFLEDGDFESADEYAEKVLDLDPECARAYVVKLLSDRKLNTQAELYFSKSRNADKLFTDPIENNANYKKALRFADPDLKRELEKDSADNAEEYDRRRYEAAKAAMERAVTDSDFKNAACMFDVVSYYSDSAQLAAQCRENAKEFLYQRALAAMQSAVTEQDFNNAAHQFENLVNYRDSADYANQCRESAEYARKDVLYNDYVYRFNKAISEIDFQTLAVDFGNISGHRDADEYVEKCSEKALEANKNKKYNEALDVKKAINVIEQQRKAQAMFEALGDFKDSAHKAEECRKRIEELEQEAENERIAAEQAAKKAKETKIIAVISFFVIAAVIAAIIIVPPMVKYNKAVGLFENGSYDEAYEMFENLGNYKDSVDMMNDITYQNAVSSFENGSYDEAYELFKNLGDYRDSVDMMNEVMYQNAVHLFELGEYEKSYYDFKNIENYLEYKESANYLERYEMILYHDIGEIVSFGKYEWYIFSKTENGVTLFCKDIVSRKYYNPTRKDITWEECTLRNWLNEDFYNGFTQEEKTMIAKTRCENKDNSEYGIKGGNDTEDYVFLLSLNELKAIDESMRVASAFWWLRSPGGSQDCAASVDMNGSIDDNGDNVSKVGGVRPALNLDFTKTPESPTEAEE